MSTKLTYLYGSSCSKDYFGLKTSPEQKDIYKQVESNDTWENIRFLIEKQGGMHSVARQKKANMVGSYIEGYLWKEGMENWRTESTPLKSTDVLTPRDKIIIIRKPLIDQYGKLMNPYVPEKYKASLNAEKDRVENHKIHLAAPIPITKITNDMTEEEKIHAMMEEAKVMTSNTTTLENRPHRRYAAVHAADEKDHPELFIPPPGYVCHRCNIPGHFKDRCPTLNDREYVSMDQRRPAMGIPKTMLQTVSDDEVTLLKGKGLMRQPDGSYVRMKRGMIKRHRNVSPQQTHREHSLSRKPKKQKLSQ